MKPELLKAERVKRGWSQTKVADSVGVDVKTVGRWERGLTVPYPYFRERLCSLFERTPEQLGLLSDDESKLLEPLPSPQLPVPDKVAQTFFLADPSIPPPLESASGLVGRQDLLRKVKESLLAGHNVTLRSVDDLPGIGKTTFAAVLAMDQQIQAHFCDGILWAGLGGAHSNVLGHLTRWGMLLGIMPNEVENVRSPQVWGQVLRTVIGTRRLLLILDDVWTAEDALSLQVGGTACAHVVITGSSEVACALDQMDEITIPQLDERDRVTLLSRFVPELIKQDPQGAQALMQAVSGLPLALTLMGSYLVSQPAQSHPLQMALALLHDTKELLHIGMLEEELSGLEKVRPPSLYAVIAMCHQQLSPQTQAALYALAVSLPKPESFSEKVALAVIQQPVETVYTLCDVGLLEVQGLGCYLLHRAVADYSIRTQGQVSGKQEIDGPQSAHPIGKQERKSLPTAGFASLVVVRKEDADRGLRRGPLTRSADKQDEPRIVRIISSLTGSAEVPQRQSIQMSRLLELILLLCVILAIYSLLPIVIAKFATSLSSTISTDANPYPPFNGKLVINDPLSDNSRGYGWQTNSNEGSSCLFIGGAYHAIELLNNAFTSCHVAYHAINLAFEIKMTIISGTCGGLVLRDTMNVAHAYSFQVCQNGFFRLYRFDGFSSGQTIQSGFNSAIITGLNQSNVIAAVANGDTFDLYVNHHKVASINDSSYTQGQFGVSAEGDTEAAYADARVWML